MSGDRGSAGEIVQVFASRDGWSRGSKRRQNYPERLLKVNGSLTVYPRARATNRFVRTSFHF